MEVNDAFTMRICMELQGCPERRFSPEAMAIISHFESYFIQLSSFSYLCLVAFNGFPLKIPRSPNEMLFLIEIVRQALQVNILSESLKKKGYEFPMKVRVFNYDTHMGMLVMFCR